MKNRDFLSVSDLSAHDLSRILESSARMKRERSGPVLAGKTLALLFEKPSLRTRVSFDVAMNQLQGHSIYLSPAEVGLGTRESIPDAARTLSRYVDIIAARTFAHVTVELLAEYAGVPVINALSDAEHPCQALADILTIREKKGRLRGLKLAYIGDGNNVANSLLLACSLTGIEFSMAAPEGYSVQEELVAQGKSLSSGTKVNLTTDPSEAVRAADIVYTDVWTSMGQEAESAKRRGAFVGYQVTAALLAQAAPDAIFMHPLPAHHGEEVAPGIIDSPQAVVFDQAENRLHVQKAILVELLDR